MVIYDTKGDSSRDVFRSVPVAGGFLASPSASFVMIFAFLLIVAVVKANGLNWNSPDWPSQDELQVRELRAGGPPLGAGAGAGEPPSGDLDLGAQLANLKAMAEKLERLGDFAGNLPRPFPNMCGLMEKSPIECIMEKEMRPLPNFTIPEFYNNLRFPERIYDSIDYEEARPEIEKAIEEAIEEGLPPHEVMRKIVPILYRLRSGCTVNVLQRWLSVAFKQWSEDGKRHLTDFIFYNNPEPVDNIHDLMAAVQNQVLSEVERTIFGPEFEGFLGVTRFMTKALSFHANPDDVLKPRMESNSTVNAPVDPIPPNNVTYKPDPVDAVFGLSRYMLQCTPRTTYLQGFLSRLEKLRKNILFVEPFLFTVRVLKSIPPPPCGDDVPPRQIFRQTYNVIKNILGKIQNSLGETMSFVENALIFKNDDAIWEVFPNLLEEDGTYALLDVLARLRNPPVRDSSEPSGTDTSTPEPPPVTAPEPPTTPVPSSPPTGTIETPSRRNKNDLYNQSNLLELLLKSLVSAERNSS